MNEPSAQQGCGAGVEAILDGWSRSQKLLDGGTEASKLGFGSTATVCGTSELQIIKIFSDFLDQIALEPEPEPKASRI